MRLLLLFSFLLSSRTNVLCASVSDFILHRLFFRETFLSRYLYFSVDNPCTVRSCVPRPQYLRNCFVSCSCCSFCSCRSLLSTSRTLLIYNKHSLTRPKVWGHLDLTSGSPWTVLRPVHPARLRKYESFLLVKLSAPALEAAFHHNHHSPPNTEKAQSTPPNTRHRGSTKFP